MASGCDSSSNVGKGAGMLSDDRRCVRHQHQEFEFYCKTHDEPCCDHRILKHLQTDDEHNLKVQDIYEAYRLENIIQTDEMFNLLILEQFALILKRIFKIEPKRKILDGKKMAFYPLKWRVIDHNDRNETFFNLQEFEKNKPDAFLIKTAGNSGVTVLLESGYQSNSDEIYKSIKFLKDTFTVKIRERNIDLNQYLISDKYKCSKDGLLQVLQQVKQICLCEARDVCGQQKLEMKKNYYVETLSFNGKNKEVCRSKFCKDIVPITFVKDQHCYSCKRLTLPTSQKTLKMSDEEKIRELLPSASEKQMNFLKCQIKNSPNVNKKQNRWERCVINECLNWYTTSPISYMQVRNSGMLLLPSPSLLLLYKNSIQQKAGINRNVFLWMDNEADRMKIPEFGRIGGIIFDEMSIQQKIEIQKSGKNMELVGFVETGKESENLNALREGHQKKNVGTHILQFLFQGLTGFRFPFAHFVTGQVTAVDIYILFWEAVNTLNQYGFITKYVCMDGAITNRSFFKMHFPTKDAIDRQMKAKCPCNPLDEMIFLMDPSHTFKKIRNNILKSGCHAGSTRLLTLPSRQEIHWSMWVDAFKWDSSNPIQIHKKLTNEHLFPNTSEKMRNKLAEDVLDCEMLNLMLSYQEFLGQHGVVLNGAIELLENTSVLVTIFRDRRPLNESNDARLEQLKQVQMWFLKWQNEITSQKNLMSMQCLEDIQSTTLAFIEFCNTIISSQPGYSVVPAMINSDVIENTFCQQRGKFNGLNTNPTALNYRNNINGIILGQRAISKKSNAMPVSERPHNFAFSSNTNLRRAVKRSLKNVTPVKSIKCIKM